MLAAEAEQSRRVERFRAELHRIVGERDGISFKVNGGCVEAKVEDRGYEGTPEGTDHSHLFTQSGM